MKQFKKILGYLISPFTVGLVVTIAIQLTARTFYAEYQESPRALDGGLVELLALIHEKTVDMRMIDRGPVYGSDRVAILAVDERAVEHEGRWPWPRKKIAHIVERAVEQGAKIIAFDAVFSEDDQNSSRGLLQKLERDFPEISTQNPKLSKAIAEQAEEANSDGYFGKTIEKLSNHLVMGAFYDGTTDHQIHAFTDGCLNVFADRVGINKFWSRKTPEIVLTNSQAFKMPLAMVDHLQKYFSAMESAEVTRWMKGQSEGSKQTREAIINETLTTSLTKMALEFPVEQFQFIVQFFALNNGDPFVDALSQGMDETAVKNLEAYLHLKAEEKDSLEDRAQKVAKGVVTVLFNDLDDRISKKDQAELRNVISEVDANYCGRFLTQEDELLDEKLFADKKWNDPAEFPELSWRKAWEEIQQEDAKRTPPQFSGLSFEDAFAMMQSESSINPVLSITRWVTDIPVLSTGARHAGYFNAVLDPDGTIRRSTLIARLGDQYAGSLALNAFMLDTGYVPNIKMRLEDKGPLSLGADAEYSVVEAFNLEDVETMKSAIQLPVDRRGRLLINYSGSSFMFPHISATEILSESETAKIDIRELDPKSGEWLQREKEVNKAQFLKDKILIFGATATGIYDLRVTPFEENFPGVETHANVISNMLVAHGRLKGDAKVLGKLGFLRTSVGESKYMPILLIVLGLTLSALLAHFGSIIGLVITAAAMAGVYFVDKFYFFQNGIVVSVLFPILLIAGLFVVLTFYKYFGEERKKRELKGTFEKYVSPSIVNEVLKDPQNISLGGKKVEMTVMFSDVRGFTTISEKLDPQALGNLLNSYLTPMTEIVFENKGTLDKYMGDAIMAFWGAPIQFADHAKHAARCALKSIVKLKELQAEYRAQGLPEIDIGIGLNTGEMSVGNMGSNTVRSYTVMGDAVNLGSRLEGITKQYGCRIIISEFTQKAIGNDFVVREMDWVKVKGKKLPVRIFELIAEGQPTGEWPELLKFWNEGFEHYHQKRFKEGIESFTQALNVKPDDYASKLYLERCQDYLATPPPEEWDGVFTMTTK